MRFIDPYRTTCHRCSVESLQRVADLLSLNAICPACGASLAEAGREMRTRIDEWGTFVALVEIAMELESNLNITLSDAELDEAKTLRQLAAIVDRHLPACPETAARSLHHVTAAALKTFSCNTLEISLDTPIMDAIAPSRWMTPLPE